MRVVLQNKQFSFSGAVSRFPLYLLFRFAPQKDAAAIGAMKRGVHNFKLYISIFKWEKNYSNSLSNHPVKNFREILPPLQRRGILSSNLKLISAIIAHVIFA